MYSIKKINYQVAADVWEGSPNSSVFNNPNFLKILKILFFWSLQRGRNFVLLANLFIAKKQGRYS